MPPGACCSNYDVDDEMNEIIRHENVNSNENGNGNGNTICNGNGNTNGNTKEEEKKEEEEEEKLEATIDESSSSMPSAPPSPLSSSLPSSKFTYPPKSIKECNWIRNVHVTDQALLKKPTIDDIKEWTFDPLLYKDDCLTSVFPEIIQYYDFHTKYNIPVDTLNAFSVEVMKNHHPGAIYHNWFHITSVLHMTFMFLSEGGGSEYLHDIDIFALLFSAFIHDVDHPGHNNDFEVNTNSVLSERYDKQSVLENNSVDVTYKEILSKTDCNILSGSTDEFVSELKQLIREVVLITDVGTYHGGLLKNVIKLKEEAAADALTVVWDTNNTNHRLILCQTIIKAADISNPILCNPEACKDWCLRICTEFKLQSNEEKKLQIKTLPMLDVNDEYEISKGQIGFYMFLAVPYFAVVGDVLPKTKFLLQYATTNLNYYKEYVTYVDDRRKSEENEEEENGEKKEE